jgi:hypothetical protein
MVEIRARILMILLSPAATGQTTAAPVVTVLAR